MEEHTKKGRRPIVSDINWKITQINRIVEIVPTKKLRIRIAECDKSEHMLQTSNSINVHIFEKEKSMRCRLLYRLPNTHNVHSYTTQRSDICLNDAQI